MTVRLLCADPSFCSARLTIKTEVPSFLRHPAAYGFTRKYWAAVRTMKRFACRLPSGRRISPYDIRPDSTGRDREHSFRGIAEYIKAAVSQRPGNYLVYFLPLSI